jgi:hypothetical protein
MQHEMTALESRRQRGATDAEKSKSAKVNVECYVMLCYVTYANIYQSPLPRSDTHGHDT